MRGETPKTLAGPCFEAAGFNQAFFFAHISPPQLHSAPYLGPDWHSDNTFKAKRKTQRSYEGQTPRELPLGLT